MSRRSSVPAVLSLAVALTAAALAPPVEASLYQLHPDVVYGHKDGMALTYDVIEPAESNGAGVLFMVSGGWVSRWFDPQAAVGRSMALSRLLDEGFTLFLVRHGSSPRFKVPDAVVDVRRALGHIREHAGTWSVDRDRLGVFGGSAGGHLSLMLGVASEAEVADAGASPADRVAAVVAYFPPVDLRPIVGPNDRFPALEFDPELGDDVSPILYVSPDDPPTLLIHGDQDELVPLGNSESIHSAFAEHGVHSELVVIEGAAHGFAGEAEAEATAELVAWFQEHLAPAASAEAAQTAN